MVITTYIKTVKFVWVITIYRTTERIFWVEIDIFRKYAGIKCQLDATDDIYCRSYCLLNMFRAPLCPSSGAREYCTDGRCLWYLVLWFSSCRYGVEQRVMCPACSLLWYLLQILLLAQHVSGTIMPIIRSSRVLYRWSLPVVIGALVFKLSVWYGAEGYVSGLRAAAAATTCIILSSSWWWA